MLSRREAQAWSDIERRLTRADGPVHRSVAAQTCAPLLLAAVSALLGFTVAAFLLLFLVPVGLVVHMTRHGPPW
jgi:hypothetical protein